MSSPFSQLAQARNSRIYDERDSSDDEGGDQIELVTGFDQFGVQRLHEKKQPAGPLVIPALKNRDWREQARKRRSLFVPDATPATGSDGSVGGLGTQDTINSGPQLAGIYVKQTVKDSGESIEVEEEVEVVETTAVPEAEETEDQRAIRALLASAQQDGSRSPTGPQIDIIPAVTEDAAYQQDVETLPESATLEDYERVPVSQFGAALLRGMGWKEGTGASRSGKGPVKPFLPQARPALLGIGGKEREVFDDGSTRRKGRDRAKYMPVLKRNRDSKDGSREASSSRRRTASPDHRGERDRRDSGYDRPRDGYRRQDMDHEEGSNKRDHDRDQVRRREDRDYKDRDYKKRKYSPSSKSRHDRDINGRRHKLESSSDRSHSRRDSNRRGS